jgi:glucosamine--fructose-6-phosphate aminotransferase (isomerizing)
MDEATEHSRTVVRARIIRNMSLGSELAEQPKVVRRLLAEGWPDARACGRRLARVEHLTLAARGSSDNAATYGKYLFEGLAGVVTALAAPSLHSLKP